METRLVMVFRQQESETGWVQDCGGGATENTGVMMLSSGVLRLALRVLMNMDECLYVQIFISSVCEHVSNELEGWGWFFKGLGVFNCSSAVTDLRSYTDLIGSDSGKETYLRNNSEHSSPQ